MRFVGTFQETLSQRLFALYMRQPFAFHLQRNSAELLRNVVVEINELGARAVIPALTLLVEGLVLGAIVLLLLVVQPVGTLLGAALTATSAWVLYPRSGS